MPTISRRPFEPAALTGKVELTIDTRQELRCAGFFPF